MRLALAALVFGLAIGCAAKTPDPLAVPTKPPAPPLPPPFLAITKNDAKTYGGGMIVEAGVPGGYLLCLTYADSPHEAACISVGALRAYVFNLLTTKRAEP